MNKNNETEKLNLMALVAIATGQVIGVGVINTTGLAIAETGRSTWLAYALAVVMGFVWVLPTVFFASIAKFKGGNYTIVHTLLGERAGACIQYGTSRCTSPWRWSALASAITSTPFSPPSPSRRPDWF